MIFNTINYITNIYKSILYFNIALKNNALALENENLKLKALHFNNEINVFKDKLAQQNKAIDKLKLDLKPKETLKEVLKVDKVFIKDKSCESELKAYKELFNILGAKK